jgi:hypothetical protein
MSSDRPVDAVWKWPGRERGAMKRVDSQPFFLAREVTRRRGGETGRRVLQVPHDGGKTRVTLERDRTVEPSTSCSLCYIGVAHEQATWCHPERKKSGKKRKDNLLRCVWWRGNSVQPLRQRPKTKQQKIEEKAPQFFPPFSSSFALPRKVIGGANQRVCKVAPTVDKSKKRWWEEGEKR